jgi:nicotinate phosphoribosyltransferase
MDKYHVSIIDSDLYKISMQNAICKLYPSAQACYTFKNRDNREFPDNFAINLREIINNFKDIKLTDEEYNFLREKCYYLNPVYLDYLKGYRYDPNEVVITQEGPSISIKIVGNWAHTILWEVPLMATISELYFEMIGQDSYSDSMLHDLNKNKAQALANLDVFYSEFGTRRRYSFENQDRVVSDLKKYGNNHMLGTSNMYLAMKHNLTPLGTLAHEFYSAHGAKYGYKMANEMANEAWISVYNGELGTTLPDTFTTDVFLRSFNTKYAKLFDGIRQDSGQPLVFIDKVVNHYKKLRINPMYKYAMFSDNLKSIEQIKTIHDACKNRIVDRYGLGTWLSNDVGVKPLNMVIKLTGCNFEGEWLNCVKLSDDPGKHTGDTEEVKLCQRTLGLDY